MTDFHLTTVVYQFVTASDRSSVEAEARRLYTANLDCQLNLDCHLSLSVILGSLLWRLGELAPRRVLVLL
jgi:hypothetical protein